jgi:hypothetical protein
MNTDSDTPRAIDRKQTNTLLLAVMVLALAFSTSCSMSLVDKTPEILRYCQVAERSDASRQPDAAGQGASAPANDDNSGCPANADGGCADDTNASAGRGQQANCDL